MRSSAPAQIRHKGRTQAVGWAPHAGPQTRFLSLGCYEALYGGAAGGGKSDALLAGALRQIHHPAYTAIIFRRKFTDLEKSLIERSRSVVKMADPEATYNDQKHTWRFKSGARLIFSHMEHESNRFDHQGAEYQYIAFDELTHFTEAQYTYLLSRGRSSQGLPIRIRAATNPGGVGHEWVQRRFAPWLDPASEVTGDPGQVLWYRNTDDGEEWVPKGTPGAFGRVFVPARRADNPSLDGTGYDEVLAGLDPVTRAQLRDGNWLIKPAAGLLFKRQWCRIVKRSDVPAKARRVRWWDRAATEPSKESPDPDWTIGCRVATDGDMDFVEDVVRERCRPASVEEKIIKTAMADGRDVTVGFWQDPGSAGKFEVEHYRRLLKGFHVEVIVQSKDKQTYFRPVSSQAEGGHLAIVEGAWNEAFLLTLEAFPDPNWHDDDADALSGAHACLHGSEDPRERLRALNAGLGRFSRGLSSE